MTVMEGEFRALVGVRAFAAGFVVAWHAFPILLLVAPGAEPIRNALFGFAVLAVDFFFILSGFIIAEKYLDSMTRLSWERTRHFYTLRFARIWPVHVALVVAYVVFDQVAIRYRGYGIPPKDAEPLNVAMNVLMLQGIPPGTSINPPAWSIAVEFGAYLLFPLAALVLARFHTAPAAFVAAFVLLLVGATLYGPLYADASAFTLTYSLPWMRIAFGFTAGALLNIGWRSLRNGRYGGGWDVVVAVATAIACMATIVVGWSGPFVIPSVAYPFLGVVVLATAGSTGVIGRILGSGPVEWCGRISYSIYLTHFLVITLILWVFARIGAEDFDRPVQALLGGVAIVVIAVAAVASYYVLEEPARRGIRDWERRRTAVAEQAGRDRDG